MALKALRLIAVLEDELGMNLKQFADLGGCRVVLCGPGWGGRYGYMTDDAPNCTVCGFKTKAEARERWMADTFGEVAGAAVQKLMSSNVELTGSGAPAGNEVTPHVPRSG